MKSSSYLMIISFLVLIIPGCDIEDWPDKVEVTGTGPIISRSLDLPSFNKIENTGIGDFDITIGTPQSVVLKAQQNIIDVMTYKVVNQTLKVGIDKDVTIEGHEGIRFEITIPEIKGIVLSGVGDFELSGNDQSTLSVTMTGVGNIEAYEMKVNTCNVTLTGVGDCKLYVLDQLNVTITGVGYVYYKGDPVINSKITGLGKLIDDN
jgi:hypothetical protein